MDDTLKIVKRIEAYTCPHCNKEIFISTQTGVSRVVSVIKKDDIDATKKVIKERLEEIEFINPKDKKDIIKWLDDKSTLLDNSDIESLLKQIAIEQLKKKKNE